MAGISKAWDWSRNTQGFWNEPSEDSHYLVHRWRGKDYRRILDLGCGLGRHSILFARNGFDVDSFDLSADAVAELEKSKANLKLRNIACATGDMNELPYPDGSFDCLLAYHVISHTDSRGIKDIVREMRRTLKPGGEMFVSLCSKDSWSFTDAGYPKHDGNTVIKTENGPENGVPHYYSDEGGVKAVLADFRLISLRHVKDIILDGSELRKSWHYFALAERL
jgi:SAM-dependent methyltransferase